MKMLLYLRQCMPENTKSITKTVNNYFIIRLVVSALLIITCEKHVSNLHELEKIPKTPTVGLQLFSPVWMWIDQLFWWIIFKNIYPLRAASWAQKSSIMFIQRRDIYKHQTCPPPV